MGTGRPQPPEVKKAWREKNQLSIQSIAKIEKEWGSTFTFTYACTGKTLLPLFYMLSYLQ
jgi:hypothetical protein